MAAKSNQSKNEYFTYLTWFGTGILDYLNTCGYYISYLTPALLQVFRQTWQFIFFPIYALDTVIYAALAFNTLLTDRDPDTKNIKTENLLRFLMNLTTAILVITAAVLSLAFAASLGFASTIIFAINLGLTGCYNLLAAGYHFYRYAIKKEQDHLATAISHLVIGTTIALFSIAGGLVVFGGWMPCASIGIVGGVIGAAFCTYGFIKLITDHMKKDQTRVVHVSTEKTSTRSTTLSVISRFYDNPFSWQPVFEPALISTPTSQVTLTPVELPAQLPSLDSSRTCSTKPQV